MTEIKLAEVSRCSSEDPFYPAKNLLNKLSSGKCKWLCSRTNTSQSIEVELSMSKEFNINFIDVGNFNSHSVEILVAHSMRSNGVFYSLVPAFIFNTVAESKQRLNKTGVQLLNKEKMIIDIQVQKWDKIKVVCRQPFNTYQFGLSFLSLKTCNSLLDKNKNEVLGNQIKLKSIFKDVESPPQSVPKQNRNELSEFKQFISRKNTLLKGLSSPKETQQCPASLQKQFMEELNCFLEDINFIETIVNQDIKISDLCKRMEKQRKCALSQQEKKLFIRVVTDKYLDKKRSVNNHWSSLKSSPKFDCEKSIEKVNQENIKDDSFLKSHLSEFKDQHCNVCKKRLPIKVLKIHEDRCRGVRNRNGLCLDLVQNTKNTSVNKALVYDVKDTLEMSDLSPKNYAIKIDLDSSTDSESNLNISYDFPIQIEEYVSSLNKSKKIVRKRPHSFNNSPSPVKIDLTDNLVISSGNNSDRLNDVGLTQECPLCFEQIQVYNIAVHASLCNGKTEELSVIMHQRQTFDSKSKYQSGYLTTKIQLVNCPICNQAIDKKAIEKHVNSCLDS